MSELIMRRRSCRWSLAGRSCGCLVLLCGVERISCCWLPGTSSVLKEAQEAFDKQQYEQVLEQLAKLEKEQSAAPDVRRLKIRSFLKLGNPKDALSEYDKLELALKQDEDTPPSRGGAGVHRRHGEGHA